MRTDSANEWRLRYIAIRQSVPILVLTALMAGMVIGICITRLWWGL